MEKAYSGFLAEYPLCYGYWNKYSKEVSRFAGQDGVPSPIDILKRGVQAVPKSVDMWVYYCTAATDRAKTDPANNDNITEARSIFKKAIQEVGSDPRVNQKDVMLWQAFLTFEQLHGDATTVNWVYVRLLKTPFNRAGNPDYLAQWQTWLDSQDEATVADIVKGEEAESIKGLKDSVKATYEESLQLWKERLPYERQLKRYYFHVKPMPERELQAWRDYLSFEEAKAGDSPAALARLIGLYERSVVTCAQYPEFWNRYTKTLEEQQKVDEACAVYERALSSHVKRLPETYVQYAECLETAERFDRAREVLQTLNSIIPGLAQGVLALANMERRCGRLKEAAAVYEDAMTKNPEQSAFIAIRFAHFQSRACSNLGEARYILRSAVTADTTNADLLLALIDFELEHGSPADIDKLFAIACGEEKDRSTPLSGEALDEIWIRRLEFYADRGDSVATLRELRAKYAKYQSETAAARSKRARETAKDDTVDSAATKRKRESESAPEASASATPQVAAQVAPQVAAQVTPQVAAQVAPQVTTQVAPAQTATVAPAVAAPAAAGAYAMAYQQQQWAGAQQQQYAQYYWMQQQQQQQQYAQHYSY